MSEKSIALLAFGSSKWIGGIYYIRNIAYMLTTNEYITEKYSIHILTQPELVEIFDDLEKHICIHGDSNRFCNKLIRILRFKYKNVRVAYPLNRDLHILGINSVNWIMDFQHKHLPELFSKEEICTRDEQYKELAHSYRSLILSSKDSLNDFRKYYSSSKRDVYVVPFVSYIEPMITSISIDMEKEILEKYNIDGIYVCIMNQFWQHKNHKVIFEAMENLYNQHPDCNLQFIFTGKMEDYRNPQYIESLKTLLDNPVISSHTQILGFISREEQIAIMKNAAFVIQPSLFEGWGTVVEDAKVLDKTILLSDIPVHHEQMNEKCILFDPHDPVALADLIYQESQKEHHDDVEKGIADMHKRAKEYSKGFEQLLRDLEKKK